MKIFSCKSIAHKFLMCLFLLAPSAHEKKNHLKPDTSGSILPTPPHSSKSWIPHPWKAFPSNSSLPGHRKSSNAQGSPGGGDVEVSIPSVHYISTQARISNVSKAKSRAVISITKHHLTLVLVTTLKTCRVKISQRYHSNDRNKTKYFASEFIDLWPGKKRFCKLSLGQYWSVGKIPDDQWHIILSQVDNFLLLA